tara:strand:+ start:941 stop:1504 length:564 start_codon:yes stop_codon:yes gene_type:complete
LGLRSIGENRVKEAIEKFQLFEKMPKVKKRFIGHLQSNKVKKCVGAFDTIDSIHSLKILKKVSNECERSNKTIEVLLQVNTSGEKQKTGFQMDNIEEIIKCYEVPNVYITGLMTMAPYTRDKNLIRETFSLLRDIKEKTNKYLGENQVKHLSMGMSNDYEIAIEEGSTQIRLGTVLFGFRKKVYSGL